MINRKIFCKSGPSGFDGEMVLFLVARRAASSDRLREAIVVELSAINRNLQTMKEELAELSLNRSASNTPRSDW